MYKYSIGLVTAFILFTGCGGGEKGPVTPKLDTLNAQSNTSALEATLRKAGFNAASDVVTLQKDTIAFTYYMIAHATISSFLPSYIYYINAS